MIDRTLHGEEQFDFAEFKEGELAILRDEIYKMTLRLKGQAQQLTLDKHFNSIGINKGSNAVSIRDSTKKYSLRKETVLASSLDNFKRTEVLLPKTKQMAECLLFLDFIKVLYSVILCILLQILLFPH